MTCIVALEHNGKVYMGGDSAAAEGWNIRLTTTPKIFRKQKLLIGYTWSFRMGQVIQYAPNLPELSEHPSNYAYLVESFVPFIREAFRDAGFLRIDNSREEGGQFIVGIRQQAFVVNSDFCVLRSFDGYESVGCGSDYALGAMRILGSIETNDPQNTVERALETAAYFSNGVSSPFTFEVLDELYQAANS